MTKILNFALKIKGVVGRVAHAKSSDPATPPKKKVWNMHLVGGLVSGRHLFGRWSGRWLFSGRWSASNVVSGVYD